MKVNMMGEKKCRVNNFKKAKVIKGLSEMHQVLFFRGSLKAQSATGRAAETCRAPPVVAYWSSVPLQSADLLLGQRLCLLR